MPHLPAFGADLFTWGNAIALLTLTALEIILGIDNIVFIAILSGRLPEVDRAKARRTGLLLALVTRVIFLTTITFIMAAATKTLFTLPFLDHPTTGKDLILIAGGLFLIWKATREIHGNLEAEEHSAGAAVVSSFWRTVLQILLVDIVFSIDSVVTAVGMAQNLWIMIGAVIIAVLLMLAFAGVVSRFIEQHPSLKMLALSFLLMIGLVLVADGVGQHIPKGYVYFSMAFSLGVEVLNIIVRRKSTAKRPPGRGPSP